MATYTSDSGMVMRGSHGSLVIPPLLVILLFSFTFIITKPHADPRTISAAQKGTTTAASQHHVAPLPLAESTPLPTIDPIVIVAPPTSGSNASNISTTSPQPSTSPGNSLQSAKAASPNSKITVQSVTKTLTNAAKSRD